MLFIDNAGIHDPTVNLAIEEYALRHLPEEHDYLLFYINEPSIIIGKNQNTHEEINAEYVERNGIHVVRRLSGGGAVYHDLGNLNYSFITKDDGQSFHNYRKFTEPVTQALRRLGVEAELTGRNDIQVGERKISGNAQFATKGRMFTHGTLLFDSQIENVVSALNVDPQKIQSKGIKSIRSRVANIREFLERPMTVEQFRTALLESIFGCPASEVPQVQLTEEHWEGIRLLSEQRYRSWDWNYGKSPKANIRHNKRFEGAGTIDARLSVEGGRIAEIRLFGDFFGTADVKELERKLEGAAYERGALEEALQGIDVAAYFGRVDKSAFLDLLLLGV
ncbi:lipoate--protein ligase [Gordoniibacillus kamchatkensis]|uniref:lipoate--protein ligase n=1 Tax=Gordoniibacillus kamchatkensis TaxID=1590651 RepID=A0ABR5AEQ2_9BACL|nr:lipoate--protein ligase [Paenibacillus sp. VKM B-2647]KIL39526.1 lipoate--protein ligase [Paenibacillus sp. VKM B-2647]